MSNQNKSAQGGQTKKIFIQGLHCASCEKLLESQWGDIPGIKKVRVSQKTAQAEVEFEGELDFSLMEKIARENGYQISETEFKIPSAKADWLATVLVVAVILLVYKFFKDWGLWDKLDLGGSISLGVAFLIGLVASVSSCLAVVGALIIAFGEKYKSAGQGFYAKAVKPNLLFHIGRLTTFFILGGVLGFLGGEISLSGNFISLFTIIISVVMLWLGLNILGLVPSIASLGLRLPKSFSAKWDNWKKSKHPLAPLVLGGLSFFLPCGFTQSMQIFALTSGSFLSGALSLFLFALGTVPVLLLLGVTTAWLQSKKIAVFQKIAGVLIILFALFTFNSGWALQGVKNPVLTTQKNEIAASEEKNDNVQIVKMSLGTSGFEPRILKIKKGVPVRWIINGDKVSGCTNKIIIPSLKITQDISRGENIVTFFPEKSGEIPFSCWMGMVRGKFIVE